MINLFYIYIFDSAGYEWKDILPCVQWMAPYALCVKELGQTAVKFFPNIQSEDSHTIQTHVVDLNLLVGLFTVT